MRRAFTIIELIFVIIISALLAAGSFKAFESLYVRSAKAKAVTELSLTSQIVLDQLSALLYDRVPNSVIGYDPTTPNCSAIGDLIGTNAILEWLAIDETQLLGARYDGFADMNDSVRPNLRALHVSADFNDSRRNVIFAGSYDEGGGSIKACNGAFGWHTHQSRLTFDFNAAVDMITFTDPPGLQPTEIYEKFFIVYGAYAVARGADIDMSAACLPNEVDDTTLLLFYDFFPYNGDTFCADSNPRSANLGGKVAILAQDVSAFRASYLNDVIRLSIDMNRTIRGVDGGGNIRSVHISKQKAVF